MTNIFQLCYGFKVKLKRTNILSYFDIVDYFEMHNIIESLKSDIKKNLGNYEIFIVMELAQKYQLSDIQDQCFR